MKKLYLKGITLIILVSITLFFTDKLFINKDRNNYKAKDYEKYKGNLELAFFGSSHALCSYDPRIFENELQINSFNFGIQSQKLLTTIPVIKQVLKQNKLKLAVVDIYPGSLLDLPYNKRTATNQLISLDNINLSWSKIKTFCKIYSPKRFLEISPTIRNHAVWENKIFQTPYKFNNDTDYYKGFLTNFSFRSKIWERGSKKRKLNKMHTIIKKMELSKEQKELLDEIVALFKENQVPVLFTSSPYHKDYMTNSNYTYLKLIKEYLKTKNLEFVDYNKYWDELKFNKYDFRDVIHTNVNGSTKVSLHLAQYIKNKYNLNYKKIKKLDKLHNRYYLINTDFNNALIFNKINNNKVVEETGVNKVAVFKDAINRLEILTIANLNKLKKVTLKIEFDVDKKMLKNTPENLKKHIKKGKFSMQEVLGRNARFKDNILKRMKLNIPYKKFKN